MSTNFKRKFRRSLDVKSNIKVANIPMIIFVISLSLFFGTQLYINSKLSPLGKQLQSYNTEKDLLLQENREIEKDLANSQSITVVEHITNKKYKLKPTSTSQLVYVTPSVNASAQ